MQNKRQNVSFNKVSSEMISYFIGDVVGLLNGIFEKTKFAFGISHKDIFDLAQIVVTESGFIQDLSRFADSDPAAKKSCSYVYKSYKGIKAMMYYRVAKCIETWRVLENVDEMIVNTIVRSLCERSKVETGIDIHPSAEIGEGCVIDHGIGTKIGADLYEGHTVVIGETVVIGKNCTILNDVIIGAADVNKGPVEGRRHPIIGDDVTICAGVKVLGKITVGNNVFIAPGCRIIHDVQDNSNVKMLNQLQINVDKDISLEKVDAVVYDGENLRVYGENIKNCEIVLVDTKYNIRKDVSVIIVERSDFSVSFRVEIPNDSDIGKYIKEILLRISMNGRYNYISSGVIGRYLKRLT